MKSKLLCAAMLLVLPSAAPAATYNIPINLTASVYVYGDIQGQVFGHINLFPVPSIPTNCPAGTVCGFAVTGTADVVNAIPHIGDLYVKIITSTFGDFSNCGVWGTPCFNDYFPGYFPLDDSSRSLTITSHISLFNSFPDPLSPLFVSIDLPDGLTLGFVPPVENPLPAALPLFATGLGALGLLGWRRKRKAADINRAVAWGRVP